MSKFLILAAGMPAALAGKGKHGDLTEEERAAKKEEFEAKMLAEYGEDWKEQHPHGKGGKKGHGTGKDCDDWSEEEWIANKGMTKEQYEAEKAAKKAEHHAAMLAKKGITEEEWQAEMVAKYGEDWQEHHHKGKGKEKGKHHHKGKGKHGGHHKGKSEEVKDVAPPVAEITVEVQQTPVAEEGRVAALSVASEQAVAVDAPAGVSNANAIGVAVVGAAVLAPFLFQ